MSNNSNRARHRRNTIKAAQKKFKNTEEHTANRAHEGFILNRKTGQMVCKDCGKTEEELRYEMMIQTVLSEYSFNETE